MAKIMTSPNVTFMDTTDNRKLDVYITSNLPTVQIKNSNTNPVAYTPNWASTPLVLEADAYLDSQDVNNKTTFSWYKKNALGVETLINANAKTITIKNNALDDGQLVVYVCKALYRASEADNGVEDFEQITFTQMTAGVNGQDGTSVTILGSYDTLSALQLARQTGNAGDAYLIGGRLYVWAVDNGEWKDVGNIQGPKGDSGVGIRSVTITYGVSDTSSTQPTSWQTSVPATAEGKYLWTRTVIDYTDDSIPDTVTYIYAKQGSKGDTGTAGSSVTVTSVQYQEGASATVAPTGTWSNTVVTAAEGKYLWTKTTFSDGKTAYGVAKQGVSGKDGVGINSTTVDYGVSDSATVRPTSWQQDIPVVAEGQYLWTRTVIDYTDTSKADTVTYTYAKQGAKGDTGVAGSSVTVASIQYQEGASATTAPTGTWSPVVVAVAEGKYLWTKTSFSDGKIAYGVAKQGNQGNPGSPATSYWLMSSASVVQKSASGTVVLTPSTLTFTSKSQTGTSTPIDYGCRWIIAYSTDGSTYTNVYTSTANETTKTFTVDSTYKTIRVRMYLAGGTTTLLDEQIIPVVTDGAIGTPGTDAVTFQIYSSNGYALSINTPTVTLQTFAYIGDVAITAGATYQWYVYNDSGWTAISGGTNAYLAITREDVAFSKSYMCKMTFNDVEYTSVATIDDKNDENKVFTTKPSNYAAGDLWVVGVDYAPAGVAAGTLLRAEHTNVTYGDVDWVAATKYDKELNDLKDNIETYNQYFSFDSTEGLKISAKDNNGTPSQFSTSLTNERLSFNYGNEAIAYINGTKMNIKEAEIESPLTVTGKYSGSTMLQAPVINIGNFSIIVESNGSLSFVANT